MERGSFVLGRLTSASLNARINNYPVVNFAERKTTLNNNLIGIDRAVIFDDGSYNNQTIQLIIGFEGKKATQNVQKFMSVLDSGEYVDLQMYSDSDYIYQVYRQQASTMARPSYSDSYREVTLTLSCAPYKYLATQKPVSVKNGAESILTNPTNFNAKPIITINATGNVDLTVNGKTTHIKNVTKPITINSELQDAYVKEGRTVTNANSQISVGAYPLLKAGKNTISISNGTATVETRYRTL